MACNQCRGIVHVERPIALPQFSIRIVGTQIRCAYQNEISCLIFLEADREPGFLHIVRANRNRGKLNCPLYQKSTMGICIALTVCGGL